MNMAQVRKYQNAPGPLPKKKWSYKGKEYEVTDEDLRNINGLGMSNYEFDSNLPSDYDGIPSGRDNLAKKIGLITEEQFNAKYNPQLQGEIKPSIVTADKVTTVTNPTQSTKKVGKFTMNGKSLSAQLALERLNKLYANTPGGERGYYAAASKAINEGHEFVYDPSTNTFKVLSGDDGSDITSQFTQYIPKNVVRGEFAKNLGATFNTRAHQARVGGERLSTLDMNVPEEVKEEVAKTLLERAVGHTDFEYNEDGTFKDTIEQRNWLNNIRNIASYIAAEDDGLDDKWDYKNWGNNQKDREYLRSLRDELANDPEYFNNLIQRIQDGKLDESDKKLLTRMGFYKNENGASTSEEDSTASTKTEGPVYDSKWTGGTNWLRGQGIGISRNTDGSFQLTGGNHGITNGAYYLGGIEDFDNSIYKRGFAYNGRLYTLDEAKKDATLSQIIQPFIGARSDNYDDWWKQRNESGVGFINQGDSYFQNYDYNTHYLDGFWKYFNDNNLSNVGIADESRWFNDGNIKVLSFVDPRQRDAVTGDLSPKYLIQDSTDPSGYKVFNSINEVARALGKTKLETPLNPVSLTLGTWGSYRGGINAAVKNTIKTKDGKENSILIDRNGNQYLYRGDNGKPLKIKNTEVLNAIINSGRAFNSSELEDMLKNWQYLGDNAPTEAKAKGAKFSSRYAGRGGNFTTYYNDKGEEVAVYGRSNSPTDNFHWIYPTAKKAQGGTIDWKKLEKLQWGGYFNSNNAKKAVVIDKPEQADISQVHEVFNPSDGGLTDAEKFQLAGSVVDLLGVGASFIPGIGQAAGAITGVGGSLTRFAGDIKQNGLDWGDVKNLGVNLGFDLATLFTGGVGKTAKFVKGIKTVAKPLMIALAAKGAWDAKDVVGKVAKGEKLTSQDMNTLLQGISMVVASGHGVKQSVKEMSATKQVLSNKAAASTKSKTITVTNNKGKTKPITIDQDEIKNIIGDKKTFAEVKKAIEKHYEVSPNNAQRIMKEAGITAGKGELRWNPFKKNTDTPFLNRGPATVVFNSNKPGIWKGIKDNFLLLSPKARQQVLEEAAKSITKKDLELANNYRMGRLSDEQKEIISNMSFGEKSFLSAIGDMAVWNPSAFKEGLLGDVAKQNAFTWGGVKYERTIKSPEKKNIEHKEFNYRNNDGSLKTKYRSRVSITGTESNPIFTTRGRLSNELVRFPWEYKHGGELPMLRAGNALPGEKLINGVNLAQVADFSNMIAQTYAKNKSYDLQHQSLNELKKRQFITPQLITPTLNTGHIDRKYNAASDQLRRFIPVSPDMTMNLAGNLAIAEKQSDLEMQKGAELSNAINIYNSQLNEILNKQQMLNAETANEKSHYLTGLNSQGKMLDAQHIEDWWASIGNTYFQGIRQRLWDNQEESANVQYQKTLQEANSQLALDKEAAISGLRSEYKSAYSKDPNIGTFETWIASNPALKERYEEALNPLTNFKTQKEKYDAAVEKAIQEKQRVNAGFFYKRGGNIRPIEERIAENADKEARRAVQKMNDNLFKILQQLIK